MLPSPDNRLPEHSNVVAAYSHAYADKGINPFCQWIIADAKASVNFRTYQVDKSPTLTKSRASQFGYWASLKGGALSIADMCRLQGFLEEDLDYKGAKVSSSSFAGCIGNACSVTVLTHLLPEVLLSAGLVSRQKYTKMLHKRVETAHRIKCMSSVHCSPQH